MQRKLAGSGLRLDFKIHDRNQWKLQWLQKLVSVNKNCASLRSSNHTSYSSFERWNEIFRLSIASPIINSSNDFRYRLLYFQSHILLETLTVIHWWYKQPCVPLFNVDGFCICTSSGFPITRFSFNVFRNVDNKQRSQEANEFSRNKLEISFRRDGSYR